MSDKISHTNIQSLEALLKRVESDPDNVIARVALAEYYLRNDSEDKIADTLLPLEEQYPFAEPVSRKLYNRLLAFGYAHNGSLVDAEKVCERAIAEEPNGLDYQFVLCFVRLSLRENAKAIEHGKNYISIMQRAADSNYPSVEFSATENHLSQVHNFVGSAYYERAEWDEAQQEFEQSRQLDPGNHLPFINLANIARNRGDVAVARKVIKEGMSQCRDVQELRLLDASMQHTASISACMIVKNEEKLLPECLESIRDWVDEIILVDTGSTDSTVEIAQSYGAKIFHQPWEGDFSKHRNYSLDQATGDWIFIIDADERFVPEDIAEIRRLMNQDEVSIISINVYNVYGDNEQLKTFLPSVRFWRRELDLKYEGIVHNLLKLGEEHPVVRSGARIKHLGYGLSPEKMQQKFRRSKELLEKQLEENPDNFFALFNYAQLLKGEGADYPVKNVPKVIESAQRAVDLTDPSSKAERHIHLMCLDQIAWANYFKRDFDQAHEYADRALQLKPDYLDALMLRAHAFAQMENWEKAKKAYEDYLNVQSSYNPSTETDCLILTHIDNRASAYYGLALIAELSDDLHEAKTRFVDTLEAQPTYMEANLRLANIYFNEGDTEKARQHFSRQLALVGGKSEAAIGLATIHEREGDAEKAENYYQTAIDANEAAPEVYLKYGQFLLSSGRDSEAAEQLSKAVTLGEASPAVRMRLADVYFKSGRFPDAAETYHDVMEKHGSDAEILNNLGNCYFQSGEFEEAEKHYEKALECEKPPNLTYRNLGLARARLEKYAEALDALSSYSANLEKEPEISKVFAELSSKTGEYEQALSHYETFLTLRPEDAGALFGLSECYLLMGHTDSASLGYRKVLEIDPNFEPARNRLESLSGQTVSS